MLCDHLEGWDREGGREMQEEGWEGDARGRGYGDISISPYAYMYAYS